MGVEKIVYKKDNLLINKKLFFYHPSINTVHIFFHRDSVQKK